AFSAGKRKSRRGSESTTCTLRSGSKSPLTDKAACVAYREPTASAAVPTEGQMVAQLSKAERQSAIAIVLGVLVLGAVLAVAGIRDPLGIHGLLIVALSLGGLLYLLTRYDAPEPDEDRALSYYD